MQESTIYNLGVREQSGTAKRIGALDDTTMAHVMESVAVVTGLDG